MRNVHFLKRITLGMLMVAALGQPLLVQAHLPVPPSRDQQAALLTRFYYESAIQVAAQGGTRLASDLMGRVYSLNPSNIEIALGYARILEAQQEYPQLLAVYQGLLASLNDSMSKAALHYQIAQIHHRLRQTEQSIESLKAAIALYPGTIPAGFYYDLGVYYAELNQFEQTRQYSQKALEQIPDSAEAWNNYGYSLAKLGHYDEGLAAVEKSLLLSPHNPNALDSLGYVLYKLGRYEESVNAFEKAIALNPAMTDTYLFLGRAYEACEQWEKAIKSYDRYIELSGKDNPEKTAIEQKLLQLKERLILKETSQLSDDAEKPVIMGLPLNASSVPHPTLNQSLAK